jgi:streptomycin 6-kinase
MSGTRFKMIDPEGMLSEQAHDVAIPLRSWTSELSAGDTRQLMLQWCEQMATAAGIAAVPIWQWSSIERVSTGLLLADLNHPLGTDYLTIADALTDVHPPG